jgi:hypothetical protein
MIGANASRRCGVAVVAWVALTCLSACHHSPTAPSGTAALTLQGVTTLSGSGVTSQLTAVFVPAGGASQDVSAKAAWQSSDPTIATVSNAGLVTGRGFGTATISAAYQTLTATASLSVSQSTIAACQSITQPGSYTLPADVNAAGPGTTCITIQASNVQLDCQGHAVTGDVRVVNGVNDSVTNCRIMVQDDFGLFASGSRQFSATNNVVEITTTSGVVSCGICLQGGSNNTVVQNTVRGGWDGMSYGTQGTDDGVLVASEANDVVSGNTIGHVFDAGIEMVGTATNLTISDNVVSNAGIDGVGAYWSTAWQGNTVSGNTVSATAFLVDFEYDTDATKAPIIPGSFQNVVIRDNVLRNPTEVPMAFCDCGRPEASFISLDGMTGGIGGNVIEGNDFGKGSPGPVVEPLSSFTDGGNICAPGGTLACSAQGSSPSSTGVTPDALRRILRLRRTTLPAPPRPPSLVFGR